MAFLFRPRATSAPVGNRSVVALQGPSHLIRHFLCMLVPGIFEAYFKVLGGPTSAEIVRVECNWLFLVVTVLAAHNCPPR